MSDYFWQLVFADLLFLGLAACLGLWFRGWLRGADGEVDRRLRSLEAHEARLERLAEQVQSLCQYLEERALEQRANPVPGSSQGVAAAASGGQRPAEERYAQAWRLVDQGVSAAEVARRLDLGLAEVELMMRIQRYRSRS